MEIKELTKAELEIMLVIWSGPKGLFLAEIISRIPEPKPAYTTVSTVIRVLVRKGFVVYEEFGKSNRYKAAVSKDDYSVIAMKRVKRTLFNDSFSSMLSFLSNQEQLTPEEKQELIAFADSQKQ